MPKALARTALALQSHGATPAARSALPTAAPQTQGHLVPVSAVREAAGVQKPEPQGLEDRPHILQSIDSALFLCSHRNIGVLRSSEKLRQWK